MKTFMVLAALLFAPAAFADAGVSDAGTRLIVAMPVEHVMGSVTLEDGGTAPALMLPDGGVITVMQPDTVDTANISKEIADAVQHDPRGPGKLSAEDLANYRAKEREPLCIPYPPDRWRVSGTKVTGDIQTLSAYTICMPVSN